MTAPRLHDIKLAVCGECGISMLGLVGERRCRDIARSRQIGMYLCRMLTRASLPRIGEAFGGRDHTARGTAYQNMRFGLVVVR